MPRSALIVVDMINSYDHPDGDELARSAERALPQIVRLTERAVEQDVLTIYVNDNFGAWTSNRDELVERALGSRHAALVEPLKPRADTAFVVKARHSIFYETPLEYLLRQEDVERIVLVGQVTEQCILYSALDGYIRHFAVAVPSDGTAHIHEDLARCALRMMELNMRAEVAPAEEVGLS
ncbi:MAG TPA: isochorismatase family cysteine hydrolase [Solirubrobacteraceae bacterium]|nr:isochorismatase family cysteine hydrolase [Solirubrobacteraceae bacterium]